MTVPKIEERTLYPSLISYLQCIGFKAVGNTKVLEKEPAILFQLDSTSFVIEAKIGKPEIGLKATAQASNYGRKLGTQNIIILVYPEKHRNQAILDYQLLDRIALNEKVTALVLTEFWTESLLIEPASLFKLLKEQLETKETKVDFNTVVKLIENYVMDLNSIIYQMKEFIEKL